MRWAGLINKNRHDNKRSRLTGYCNNGERKKGAIRR